MFKNRKVIKELGKQILNQKELLNRLNFGFDDVSLSLIEIEYDPNLYNENRAYQSNFCYNPNTRVLTTSEENQDFFNQMSNLVAIKDGKLLDSYYMDGGRLESSDPSVRAEFMRKWDFISNSETAYLETSDGEKTEVFIESMIRTCNAVDWDTNSQYLILSDFYYLVSTEFSDHYLLSIKGDQANIESLTSKKFYSLRGSHKLSVAAEKDDVYFASVSLECYKQRTNLIADYFGLTGHDLKIKKEPFEIFNFNKKKIVEPLNTYVYIDNVLSFVNKQRTAISKNKNQLMIEKYVSKYNLEELIFERIDQEALGLKKFGDGKAMLIDRIDQSERIYLIRKFDSLMDIDPFHRYSESDTRLVVSYVAIATNEGYFEASRVNKYQFVPKLIGTRKNLYDSTFVEPTSFSYSEDSVFKYMLKDIEALRGINKLMFLTEILKGNYLESLLKSELKPIIQFAMTHQNLTTHRSITNRIGGFLGQFKVNEKSFNKIVGMTAYQAKYLLKNPFYHSSPMAVHLKMLFKPEMYEKTGYTTYSGVMYRRRKPAKEKFVSITEIDDKEYSEAANLLLDLYLTFTLQLDGVCRLDEAISLINMSGMTYNDKKKSLSFMLSILQCDVQITGLLSSQENFNHYLDYLRLLFDNKEIMAEQDMDLNSFTDSKEIIQDRFEIVGNLVNDRKSHELQKNFDSRYDNKWNRYEYEGEDYVIIAPKKVNELYREGNKLSHCVASYADSLSEGRTNVYFIREKKDLQKPFYTIEISNRDRVVQVRGFANCSPTPPVSKFVNEFKRNKLKERVS